MQKRTQTKSAPLLVWLLTLILAAAALGGCGAIAGIVEDILGEIPTAEDTYTSVADVNKAMEAAMKNGETEFTFNIADADEDMLTHIADNMATFWGSPDEYTINHEFSGVEGIIEGKDANVKNVTSTFELSNNYYVFQSIRNAIAIPDGEKFGHAREIADVLPAISSEIFAAAGETPYEQTLAVHDWLVANIAYDESIVDSSDANGSYGALIDRKTMCQGYAEALALLLKCYTEVEAEEMVGDARDLGSAGGGEPAGDVTAEATEESEAEGAADGGDASDGRPDDRSGDPDDGWVGHAWNVVKMDGKWYQVDATFDDPAGNPEGEVLHFYMGQSDEMMRTDHKWTDGYYPACESETFYYFRKSGLFASSQDEFKSIVENIVKNGDPIRMEIAATDVTLDEDNSQFIFRANTNISEIRWNEQIWQNICVFFIEPQYS
ncbi:MAG: hypothetical protein LBS85_02575 [Clostridiales Family XIII bacterium]|jgi:transglutaminase-like putative cysteine protease|nr:hypothetical protein [Clostridiales Family XIII bacterium]